MFEAEEKSDYRRRIVILTIHIVSQIKQMHHFQKKKKKEDLGR